MIKRYGHIVGYDDVDETPDGEYVLYEDYEKLQRQLDAATAERDAWKNTHDSLRAVYRDIGEALGANMPAELVNEVARRRMEELAAAKKENERLTTLLELADALINRLRPPKC